MYYRSRYPWKTEKPHLNFLFPDTSLVAAGWAMLIASSACHSISSIYFSSTQHVEDEREAKPLGLDYPSCNFKCLLDVTLLYETNYGLLINKQYLMMSILGKLKTKKSINGKWKMTKIAIGWNYTLINNVDLIKIFIIYMSDLLQIACSW